MCSHTRYIRTACHTGIATRNPDHPALSPLNTRWMHVAHKGELSKGMVAHQRAQQVAARVLPDTDNPVIASRDDAVAIECHRARARWPTERGEVHGFKETLVGVAIVVRYSTQVPHVDVADAVAVPC